MPIEVIPKRKTEPESYHKHKALVPLRIVAVETNSMRSQWKEVKNDEDGNPRPPDYLAYAEPGDVCFMLPGNYPTIIFNITKNKVIDHNVIDHVRFLRAYDIERIILTQDDEPAPVT